MKRRIVAAIVGVAVVALLFLGIPLAIAVEQFYAKEQVLYLDREAAEAYRAVQPAALRAGGVTIHDDGETHLAVYGRAGQKLSGVGPARADEPVQTALEGEPADGHRDGDTVVALPVYDGTVVVGAIRAGEPRSTVTDRTVRAWLVMALLAIAALVVVFVLARLLARRLTRPVDALVRSAERLGGGDFSVRTERSGIAELDQVATALDTTAERLGALVARERAFSADASHQLRTPLAGLRVGIEAALMTPDADDRAALEAALEPIDRLDATITDLLRLARDTHAERYPLDVARLLRELEAEWQPRAAADDRSLIVAVDDPVGRPPVAEPAVRQIVSVLLDNATRHGAGTITVRAHQSNGAVAITVADEGAGLAGRDDVFVRRANGSHGIGLPLARTLAEAEGGRLLLERPGPAPAFTLVLPLPEAG